MRKYKQTEFLYNSSACKTQLANSDELSAYIDKELPTWKRHLIRQHLKKCEVCAKQVQLLQQTTDFLHHGGDIEVPEGFLSSVMSRVSASTKSQPQRQSFGLRARRLLEVSFGWILHTSILAHKLRYNIRTRSPIYIFALTFAVFTMVGATLYQASNDRFGEAAHTLKVSHELNGEKLISFEVIQHEPPKRLLTNYLQQR